MTLMDKSKKNVRKKRQTPNDISEQQTQSQAVNDDSSTQPLRQRHGQTDKNFLEEQRMQEQNREHYNKRLQENSPVKRVKNYANEQASKVKDYGVQKGKQAINKGVDYAKDKIAQNPKATNAINKAREVKQNFENKINAFKDNAEESARKPPIRQIPGESDMAFRRRQQKENTDKPENPQRMSLKNAAKQHVKNKVKEQTDRAKDYGKKQAGKAAQAVLKSNPKLAKAVANAGERSKAIQDKIAKIKNSNVAKRIKMLKDKYNAKKLIKKKIEDEAKKLALKIAQAVARFTLQILASVAGTLGAILLKLLIVVLIVVVIIAALKYTCESNPLFDAACSVVTNIAL